MDEDFFWVKQQQAKAEYVLWYEVRSDGSNNGNMGRDGRKRTHNIDRHPPRSSSRLRDREVGRAVRSRSR